MRRSLGHLFAASAGSQGFGLASLLEEYGYRASFPETFGSVVGEHRVLPAARATARIHLANAEWVDEARRTPGAIEIAHVDPRTAAQRAEYDAFMASARRLLVHAGFRGNARRLGRDLGALVVPGLDPKVILTIQDRLAKLGPPASVFLFPPQ